MSNSIYTWIFQVSLQEKNWRCQWHWKPQCPGGLFLSPPTSPKQSSPSPSRSANILAPLHLHPTHHTLLLPSSATLCLHCHHLRDVLLLAGCFHSNHPLLHHCLVPSVSFLLLILFMIQANSSHTSISASPIWACWEEDHLERSLRWGRFKKKMF